MIDKGAVAADGPPRAVLTPALLRDTFGIRAFVQETDDGLVFQPMGVLA